MKNKKNICLKLISVLCGLLICFSLVLGLFTGVEKVMFPLTQSTKAEELELPSIYLRWGSEDSQVDLDENGVFIPNLSKIGAYAPVCLFIEGRRTHNVVAVVETFDISAKGDVEYRSVKKREFTFSPNTSYFGFSIALYAHVNNDGSQYYSKAEKRDYLHQFGVRIVSVKDAVIAPGGRSIRSYVIPSSGYDLSIAANKSITNYDPASTQKNPNAMVYAGAIHANQTQITFDNGSYSKELGKGNGDNDVGKTSVVSPRNFLAQNPETKKLFNYYGNEETQIYYDGSFYVSQSTRSGGFDFSVVQKGDSDTIRFRAGMDKYKSPWNHTIPWYDWTEYEYHTVDQTEKLASRTQAGVTNKKFLKLAGNEQIYLSIHNLANTTKKKISNVYINSFIVNDSAPTVIGYDMSNELYGPESDMYIAVRMSEPVQVVSDSSNPLKLKTEIGSETVYFTYDSGCYTDTLVFKATLDKDKIYHSEEGVKVYGFENAYDDSTNTTKNKVYDLFWNKSNTNNVWKVPTSTGVIATLPCKVDTREPQVTISDESIGIKRVHSADVKVGNISSQGEVYVAWSQSQIPTSVAWTKVENFTFDTENKIEKGELTGDYYLHVKAQSLTSVETYRMSKLFTFDNTPPTISELACADPQSYKDSHFVSARITDSLVDVQKVYLYAYNESGGQVFAQTVYDKTLMSSDMTVNDGVYSYELKASALGLPADTYGTYTISMIAEDSLGNQCQETFYENELVFDTRSVFTASIDTQADEVVNGKKIYFNGKSIGFSTEALEGTDVWDIAEIRRNGEIIPKASWADEGLSGSADGNKYNLTLGEKATGYFEVIMKIQTKESNVLNFYVTQTDATPNNYTNIYSNERLLINKVWALETNKYYRYGTEGFYATGDKKVTPIFSSKNKAMEYVRFMEYQDLSVLYLDESSASIIDQLNQGTSNVYKKAEGENHQAGIGQTWIRYKSTVWEVGNLSTERWVYYFYGEGKQDKVDVKSLSDNLNNAIETVCKKITHYSDNEWKYLTVSYEGTDSVYAQPTYDKGGIFYAKQSVSDGFSTAIEYSGDPAIYDNFITESVGGVVTEMPLIANYTFTFPSKSDFAYYCLENTEEWREINNGQSLKDVITSSGVYKIVEFSNGWKEYYIYCDFDEPVLRYQFSTQNQNLQSGYIDANLDGVTIRAASVTLKDILDGVRSVAGYPSEKDKYAYLYLTKGTNVELFMCMNELNGLAGGYALETGNYTLYLFDRLGNTTTVYVKVNTKDLEVDYQSNNSLLKVTINREANEVERFEVWRDEALVDVAYENELSFKQSGRYVIKVVDIYGYETVKEIDYRRPFPTVEFFYIQDGKTTKMPIGAVGLAPAIVQQSEENENVYFISGSTDIRIRYESMEDYVFNFLGDAPTYKLPTLGRYNAIDIAINSQGWTLKIAYENDESTYLLITCIEDKKPPVISGLVHNPIYTFNEKEGRNDVLFTNSGEISDSAILNGGTYGSKQATIRWEDDTEIANAYYVKDNGALINLGSTVREFIVEEYGDYVFTVTDMLGNTSTMQFSLTGDLQVEYYIDDERQNVPDNPIDYIEKVGNNYVYTNGQKTGKEVRIVIKQEGILAVSWYNGSVYQTLNWVYEEGVITTLAYDESTEVMAQQGTPYVLSSSGSLQETNFKVNYTYQNGELTLFFAEPEEPYERWQLCITDINEYCPRVIQFERSNVFAQFTMVSAEDETDKVTANATEFIGTNKVLAVAGFSSDLKEIWLYYSEEYTLTFQNVMPVLLYANGQSNGFLDNAGYYKVVAINEYGNETVQLVRISFTLKIDVELEYADKTTVWDEQVHRLSTGGVYDFHTNGRVIICIWNEEAEVSLQKNGTPLPFTAVESNGKIQFTIQNVGEYVIIVKDQCDNVFTLRCSIQAPKTVNYQDYLTGFNQNALYKDKFYTNAPISLQRENVENDSIAFVAYRLKDTKQWTLLYDLVSQDKIPYKQENFSQSIGKTDGVFEIVFGDAYGNMATQTVYVFRAEQLLLFRRTQSQSGDTPYDLTFAQEQGAWTNHLLYLQNTATAYRLLVDGEEVLFTDGKYQFAVPSNLGEEDDSYSVEYWDEYGNYYAFTVHLFRKTPTVTLSTEETLLNVNGTTCLRGEFAYVWEGDLNVVYTRNGQNQDTYAKGDILSEDGAYVFTFTDIAGNTTMRMLTVDTKVLYKLTSASKDVESGVNTDSGVRLHSLGEKITVQAKKDGETYKTDAMLFEEHGAYELILTDEIGNTKEIKFTIYKKAQKSFNFTVDEEYAILQVWYYQDGNNGISLVGEVVIENGKQSYHFAPNGEYDGKYQLELVHLPTGITNTLNLVIDNHSPEVTLTGVEPFMSTREDVMISGLKAGDRVVLYKDNKPNPYMIYQIENDGDTPQFTKSGKYKIVIYDEAGNSVEYEFVREFKTNTASNVVICLLMLFMAIGGLIYIRLNGKIRVK